MPDELDIISCEDAAAWEGWLAVNHRLHRGVWLKIAKKDTGVAAVTNDEAVDVGLCWGWEHAQAPGDEAPRVGTRFS